MASYELIDRADRDQLGESPFWDESTQTLYWVDIVGKRVHRLDPASGEISHWSTPRFVSAAIPSVQGDTIVSLVDGLHRLNPATGATDPFVDPDANQSNRSNETRTDPQGRIWLGTMCNNLGSNGEALELKRDSGSVFCVEPDGRSTKMLSSIGITNAFCWSPDGRRYYCADTPKKLIWSFAYDPDGPALSDRQVFVDDGPGKPDGAAMDEDGCLWSARWGGGRVIRFTPDGKVDREVMLPAKQPSCCAFGGADRRTLYITSARQELGDLPPDSFDGGLFAVRVDTPGLPMRRFAG